MAESAYLPAMRFKALTPFFDLAAMSVRDRRFKPMLIEQAGLPEKGAVLDLGCGTGTLAIRAKRAVPGTEVSGLDADPQILDQARAKAERAGAEIVFREGFSTELPYKNRSFDRVLSSLFFHHLRTDDKVTTLREVARVLRPGGELHVADIGKPGDPVMAAAVFGLRLFDGFEVTRANVEGRLPEMFEEAGFEAARERGRMRTVVGSICFYSAKRP